MRMIPSASGKSVSMPESSIAERLMNGPCARAVNHSEFTHLAARLGDFDQDRYQAYLDTIQAKTGKTPDDFRALAAEKGLAQYGEIMTWLKADYGLGHGHANVIAQILTKPDAGQVTAEERIDKLFTGKRAQWRGPMRLCWRRSAGLARTWASPPRTRMSACCAAARSSASCSPQPSAWTSASS